MDIIQTVIVAILVGAIGVAVTHTNSQRFDALERQLGEQRVELKGGMGDLRSDIRRLEAKLDSAVDSIRSDITKVALAVGSGRAESH